MAGKLPLLRVDKANIVDDTGNPIVLKGVALGGWLLMEGYMLAGRNIPEKVFKAEFERSLGREALLGFTTSFRDIFIREFDIATIKNWGANCVRVPFNYRLIEFEDRLFSLNEDGLAYLDKIIEWCGKHGLYCILDMHAAPGAQNPDWHADCVGRHEFFTNEVNRTRFLKLWRFIADRYSDSSTVAGYDVLNEPVIPFQQERMLKDLYAEVTKEIRDVDKNHIIFVEGNFWGQRLKFLGRLEDENTAYSIHVYVPHDYVLNWKRGLCYPGKIYGITWNKKRLEFLAKRYIAFVNKFERPIYVGEFGINWREGCSGESQWVKDVLDIFKKYRIHWTYWTYKSIANSIYPDGVYRYLHNPAWVHHQGPVAGWENFYSLWPKEKGRIIFSWRTENFTRNEKLYSLLKRYF